ncbi:hypothetical protein HY628_02205 [Candidatus Uhrbacteria bacterium]|nr:hypothetical protein [Candidatus Uhrbacteria bacterium]
MKITPLLIAGLALTALLTTANAILIFPDLRAAQTVATAAEVAAEIRRPANLTATIIEPTNCPDCRFPESFLALVRQNNVNLTEERLTFTDPRSPELIASAGIERLPGLVISGELNKNPDLAAVWSNYGTVKDNQFVFQKNQPIYEEAGSGEVRGRVKVTYLTDLACAECYDVKAHEPALANVGIIPSSSTTVDIASPEGLTLKKQYTLTAVPTIILSGDLAVYSRLLDVWPAVGSQESDGAYVFREIGVKTMGAYRNLVSGKIETPPPAPLTSP